MTETRINDLIFKELIKRGYSLRGNTRVWNLADSKLWYLTPEQAQAYLDLEKAKDYSELMFKAELEMLKKYMPEIQNKILHSDAINIIDIGCGDGKKARLPIDVLHKKAKIRYCPIDISSHMVTKALEEVRKLEKGEVVEFRWNISDFDNVENIASLLRDSKYRQNFFIFLGDTISNFEIHEVLYEVVEAMDGDLDYLLIGLSTASKDPNELMKPYDLEANDKFFGLILSQLDFKKDEIEFGVKFEHSRVEAFYTVKKSKTLEFSGRKVHFEEGDQILVGISHRYTREELERIMKIYFEEYTFFLDDKKSRALILCKK
ncbi:MAG: L-histidine N(alpha)-methyltransferase [archaeon]